MKETATLLTNLLAKRGTCFPLQLCTDQSLNTHTHTHRLTDEVIYSWALSRAAQGSAKETAENSQAGTSAVHLPEVSLFSQARASPPPRTRPACSLGGRQHCPFHSMSQRGALMCGRDSPPLTQCKQSSSQLKLIIGKQAAQHPTSDCYLMSSAALTISCC